MWPCRNQIWKNEVLRAPLDVSGVGASSSNRTAVGGSEKAPQGRPQAASGASLGIYTDTVDKTVPKNSEKTNRSDRSTNENRLKNKEETRIARQTARHRLHREQRAAAKLIRKHIRADHRVTKCKWIKAAEKVELLVNTYGEGEDAVRRASYKGLVICGNVWGCPVCGSRISRQRRDEMNKMLAWSREQGLIPVLITLTARHGRKDQLADLLEGMKGAKQRLRQRDEWRRLPYRGSVTATEITHGLRAGWHPHFHEIVLLEADSEAEALAMVAPLADAWRCSLRAFGLDGAEAAFDARGAANAGEYVAKWGVAAEMTMANAKTGEKAKSRWRGRLPAELAEMGANGDVLAEKLWVEFFEACSVKRRRQLVWSRGLKAACGVDEVSDEAAAEKEADNEDNTESAGEWGSDWSTVRAKRVNLMDAAERGGAEAVAEALSGPDDPPHDPGHVIEPGTAPIWMWPQLIDAHTKSKAASIAEAEAKKQAEVKERRRVAWVKKLNSGPITAEMRQAAISRTKERLATFHDQIDSENRHVEPNG